MDVTNPLWTSPAMRAAVAQDNVGTVIRLTRQAAGLNQTDLGLRCGYSASTVSRIERGQPPIHDIDVRRRIADALQIPRRFLGLSSPSGEQHAAPPLAIGPLRPSRDDMVGRTPTTGEGGDPVRRRNLLAGLAATTAATAWPVHARASAASDPEPPVGLEALLTAENTAVPSAPIARLMQALTRAQNAFTDTRYDELSRQLPALIRMAAASHRDGPEVRREQLAAILAQSYRLGSELCIKLNDDPIAWVLADRALTVARTSGHATTISDASRSVAIAMRRSGHRQGAVALLTTTAKDLDADTSQASPSIMAAYGSLLCTAAYSSAQQGSHSQAIQLIDEATRVATRHSHTTPDVGEPFGLANVAIYKIGIYTTLGETGAALQHASTVQPQLLPSPERHARYCIDTARAWEQHGNPERAYEALRIAERYAPQEVRRPSVRTLISALLYAPSLTPQGLRDLAVRVGATKP